jgi:hypothetical protein
MIFFVYYLAALILAAAELRGLLRSPSIATPKFSGSAWVVILVASYALQVTASGFLAKSGPWPFAVVQWQMGGTAWIAALLAIGLLQTYALLGLYRTRGTPPGLEIGAAIMLLISFAPVLTNADLYAYVGNGLLGRAAYQPPAVPFPGDLAAINAFWHAPMAPTTYGPLWIAVARAVTEPFGSLVLKLYALRALGALLLGCFVLLLRASGVSPRLLAVVALNPALYFEFVLNAHNDMLPACVTIAAAMAAAAVPWLAALLIAIAALVKAPFALLGLPALSRVKPMGVRVAAVALALVAAAATSWFAGGEPYLHALLLHASSSRLESWLHLIAAIAAVCAVIAAVAGMRRLRSAVWLLPLVGAYTASWYALWSVPYAIGARRVLTYLALWLPFVSMLAEPAFARLWTLAVVVPAAVILSLQLPRRKPQLQGGPS